MIVVVVVVGEGIFTSCSLGRGLCCTVCVLVSLFLFRSFVISCHVFIFLTVLLLVLCIDRL